MKQSTVKFYSSDISIRDGASVTLLAFKREMISQLLIERIRQVFIAAAMLLLDKASLFPVARARMTSISCWQENNRPQNCSRFTERGQTVEDGAVTWHAD